MITLFRGLSILLAASLLNVAIADETAKGSKKDSIYQTNDFLRTLIEQRVQAARNSTASQSTGEAAPLNPVKLDFISVSERKKRIELGYGSIQSPAGTYGVEGHGALGTLYFRNRESCTPRELANWIRGDARYAIGMKVYLYACETGKGADSFAQRLADELGATVVAPTEKLWITTGGGYHIAAEKAGRTAGQLQTADGADMSRPGILKTFLPR